jgi:coenzyme PQQ precursor peptide PqqA
MVPYQFTTHAILFPKEGSVNWTTPDFEVVSVSCEINSYAPAEI